MVWQCLCYVDEYHIGDLHDVHLLSSTKLRTSKTQTRRFTSLQTTDFFTYLEKTHIITTRLLILN